MKNPDGAHFYVNRSMATTIKIKDKGQITEHFLKLALGTSTSLLWLNPQDFASEISSISHGFLKKSL